MKARTAVDFGLVITFALSAMGSACRETTSTAHPASSAATQTISTISTEQYSVYELPSVWRNQHGDTLHLSALTGHVRVMAMVYANCHATCPLVISELKRIEDRFPENPHNNVRFVLVSLDPSRDTPESLSKWAASLGLDPARWTLLTGTADGVRELTIALNVRYQSQQNGELAHTNALTVLDSSGHVVHQQTELGQTTETFRQLRKLLQ
ncbi:MAG: SCO family protein [Gemmatimonadaceae bacterium]